MFKTRFISMLVLLMTAVTGAWAVSAVASIGSENYTTLQAAFTAAETGQTIKLLSDVTQVGGVGKSDGKAVTFDLNGHIYTCTEDYVVMATKNSQITIIDSSTGTPGGIKSEVALVSQDNGKIIIKAGRYNIGGSTAEELLEYFPLWGVEMYSGYTLQDITPADAQGFCVGVVAPTYTVALKDGTEDASNWQGKAGTGEYQSLPLTGLEASTAVSVKYSGTKIVKSVKARKKASLIVNPEVGQVIGSDGKNYAANATLPSGVTAVAKIVYVGDNCEAEPYNHGLALALSDANSGNSCKWKTSQTDAGHTKQENKPLIAESGLQYNATHNTDDYPAFKAAIANNGTAAPTGCSSWFLPSGYQWYKMTVDGYDYLGLQDNTDYWTSTERSANEAWYFSPADVNWYRYDKDQDGSNYVRACLAF